MKMAQRLRPDELRAWYAFLQAHHRVLAALDRELQAEHGLSVAAYEVLLWLAQAPGRSLKMVDLAGVVLLSPSGLTRLVDRLVSQGLVERVPCPGDRRATLAHLTHLGAERLRPAAQTHVRGIREHFTGQLDAARLGALTAALETVVGGDIACPSRTPAAV